MSSKNPKTRKRQRKARRQRQKRQHARELAREGRHRIYEGRPDYTCRMKRTYESREEAVAMATVCLGHSKTGYLRPYRCPVCGKWHLTSEAFDPDRFSRDDD